VPATEVRNLFLGKAIPAGGGFAVVAVVGSGSGAGEKM